MATLTSTATKQYDTLADSPTDANWETWTFPDWVEVVYIRSRAASVFYWSRAQTGTFTASHETYNTVPSGGTLKLELRSPKNPKVKFSTIQLAHPSGAADKFEFELLGGGRV